MGRIRLPLKSRLVMEFLDGDMWEMEAIDRLLKDEGTDSEYWKFNARFWMIEMAGSGLLKAIDERIDDEYYGMEKVVFRYTLTNLGRERIEKLLM